mmetsp:Transcript_83/g.155  ORF Transcript_83/g.155 Transcript_83/m.155 type:complete len:272 (-) Transcript_83:157-972(-)
MILSLTITDALAALALLIRSRGARHDLANGLQHPLAAIAFAEATLRLEERHIVTIGLDSPCGVASARNCFGAVNLQLASCPLSAGGFQSEGFGGAAGGLSFQLLLAVRRLHSTLLAAVIHEGAIAPIATTLDNFALLHPHACRALGGGSGVIPLPGPAALDHVFILADFANQGIAVVAAGAVVLHLPGPWSRARFAHLAAAGVALVGLNDGKDGIGPSSRDFVAILHTAALYGASGTLSHETIVLGVVQCDLATAHVHHCKSSLVRNALDA